MQTFDPLKPDYINPAHIDLLSPEARANVITVDPDAPAQADVSEAPVADGISEPIPVPLTLEERLSALEAESAQRRNEVEAGRAMATDTDGLSADEVSHLRHVLAKYFANDRADG